MSEWVPVIIECSDCYWEYWGYGDASDQERMEEAVATHQMEYPKHYLKEVRIRQKEVRREME